MLHYMLLKHVNIFSICVIIEKLNKNEKARSDRKLYNKNII